jgi:hypothetical protein
VDTTSTAADPASVARFVEKWAGAELSERAASHEHFIDLCRLVGHLTRLWRRLSRLHPSTAGWKPCTRTDPTPATADPTGADYTFEKPVKVVDIGKTMQGGCLRDWSLRGIERVLLVQSGVKSWAVASS